MTFVVPGPRPPKGHARSLAGLASPAVAVTRTARGWTVVSPAGAEDVGDLVEGLSLADLIAEEFGEVSEPDRSARRSARGPGGTEATEDLPDPRIAALERTVAQLEHALAARVSTERAIGVLAERHSITPRAAFESLRKDARAAGRPVVDLAREVLDGLATEPAPTDCTPPVALVAAADGRS